MAAPRGNKFSPGRPPDIGAQARRIEEAASKVETALGLFAVADDIGNDTGWPPVDLDKLSAEITARRLALAEQVEALMNAGRLAQQVAEVAPRAKGRRRRRRHTPDPWETEVMAAALALDRLLPKGQG